MYKLDLKNLKDLLKSVNPNFMSYLIIQIKNNFSRDMNSITI